MPDSTMFLSFMAKFFLVIPGIAKRIQAFNLLKLLALDLYKPLKTL